MLNAGLKDNGAAKYSFELFPQVNSTNEHDFWRVVGNLESFDPEFFSVTYGALGSARKKSIELVNELHGHCRSKVAAHLTCVDATQRETNNIIQSLWNHGIRHIVAISGDRRTENQLSGYNDSLALVKAIKKIGNFDVSVAAYPEVHPKAQSEKADIDCLKAKFDAGADRAITQYFFDVEMFLEFRDKCAKNGVKKPIIPGILPIHDYDKVKNFSQRCGASIPKKYALHFAGMEGNVAAQFNLALDFALELCEKLIQEGVEHLHFYTLNRSDLCLEIIKQLNLIDFDSQTLRNVA